MTLPIADPGSPRGRICAAMLKLVEEMAYPAVTIADLERVGGFDEQVFYRHFRDLGECFDAIWESFDRELERRSRAAFDKPGPWLDRFRAALAETLELVASEPAAARLYVVDSAFAGGDYGARREKMMHQMIRLFEAAPFPVDSSPLRQQTVSEALAGGIWQHVHWLIQARKARDAPKKLPQLMFLVVLPHLGPEAAEAELWRGEG